MNVKIKSDNFPNRGNEELKYGCDVIQQLDHKIILSKAYLAATKVEFSSDELVVFEVEPTAENMLVFLCQHIGSMLPEHVRLFSLRIWETRDSYAEWLA